MSTCPDCGAENVPPGEGAETHCGRRVSWTSLAVRSELQCRDRMAAAEACKRVARRRAQETEADKQ